MTLAARGVLLTARTLRGLNAFAAVHAAIAVGVVAAARMLTVVDAGATVTLVLRVLGMPSRLRAGLRRLVLSMTLVGLSIRGGLCRCRRGEGERDCAHEEELHLVSPEMTVCAS